MGMLIDGVWQDENQFPTGENGEFVRAPSVLRHWVRADGSTPFAPEADRYHLYVSYACPWAMRIIIMRHFKGLETAIGLSKVNDLLTSDGWHFSEDGHQDHLFESQFLRDIYLKSDANYTGRVTVPVLWDKQSQQIVSNESSELLRMLGSEFDAIASLDYDFYPEALRAQIDEINDYVYDTVNNGVYKCGFAKSQEAYDEAFDNLFTALDTLEAKLDQQRYLVDNTFTEADIRLFTTLIRFDSVYVGHFKCNSRRIEDYPNLSNYIRELYQMPAMREATDFSSIKNHYYMSHRDINPSGIVPKGPELDCTRKHNRDERFKDCTRPGQ